MRTDIKKRIITSCYTYNNPFCIQIFYKLPTKLGEAGRFYGAQNEAYNVERGRKTPKAVYLQRVARVEAMRSAQNETFT